ncbi:hypothetical protein JSMCR1_p546 (plasmid) [Escherichia coli]|nr:hypothetical protein JSMCR1_p546 [Escherichia coli]
MSVTPRIQCLCRICTLLTLALLADILLPFADSIAITVKLILDFTPVPDWHVGQCQSVPEITSV